MKHHEAQATWEKHEADQCEVDTDQCEVDVKVRGHMLADAAVAEVWQQAVRQGGEGKEGSRKATFGAGGFAVSAESKVVVGGEFLLVFCVFFQG